MSDNKINNNQLVHILACDYLKNAKLVGGLQKLGFDLTEYQMRVTPILELINIQDDDDAISDVIDRYTEKATNLSFFDLIELGLDDMADEMIEEIKKAANY